MLERATAKSPGGGGRDHPLKLGPEAGSLLGSGLTSLERPSMKWLETAFAKDVGGALLAFRARRHRVILSEMAWDVFKKDKHSAPFAVNTYNRTHKDMAA